MRAWLLGPTLLFVALGCGPDSSADSGFDAPIADGLPRVELGTGLANFEDIGPTMEIVFGPQGGWHLYVSCRIYNVTVDGALLTYRTERDGVLISMPNGYRLEPRRLVRARDHYLRVGDLAIFDITMPSDVVGDTVTVTVTIEPPDGDPVTDARTAMVVDEVP